MHIIKNLQNFLLDQQYYIDIFNDYIHIYKYESLLTLSDNLIELKLKEFTLCIEGSNLTISMMDNQELLIKGIIKNMRFNR